MSLVSQEAVASTETATATATETATATTTTATTTTATTNTLVGDLVPPQPEIAYYANTDAHEKPTPATAESNTSCEDDNDDDDNDEGSTFWDMFSTWYLPLLLLWLRRSMFGTANLVRSLLVGQCIRILLTQCGDLPKWAQPFTDPHAWPPPAFTALAILTFVAFIVHPDGLTWFMLGKLRYVFYLTDSSLERTSRALFSFMFVPPNPFSYFEFNNLQRRYTFAFAFLAFLLDHVYSGLRYNHDDDCANDVGRHRLSAGYSAQERLAQTCFKTHTIARQEEKETKGVERKGKDKTISKVCS
jgi:hypothetical protein